jgi:hypothetical protein
MKRIYKNFSFAAIFTALFSLAGFSQNAWINEIHYDNVATDVNEFIEVAIENPGNYTLSLFSVVLYNGNNGESYDTRTLDQYSAGVVSNSFALYYFMYPENGIQNGESDGMALAYDGTLIPGQFLSYEGTLTAVNGPASGLISVDIGVSEIGQPEGLSLQLSGSGSQYSEFAWQPSATATIGELNNGQSLGGPIGIGELNTSDILVYPNPNNGNVRMFNPFAGDVLVSLYSAYGQPVTHIMVKPGDNILSLNDVAKGIYIIRFGDKEGKILKTERMIIY